MDARLNTVRGDIEPDEAVIRRQGSEYFSASLREPHSVSDPRTLYVARRERKDRAALPGKSDQSSALAVPPVLVGLRISLE